VFPAVLCRAARALAGVVRPMENGPTTRTRADIGIRAVIAAARANAPEVPLRAPDDGAGATARRDGLVQRGARLVPAHAVPVEVLALLRTEDTGGLSVSRRNGCAAG